MLLYQDTILQLDYNPTTDIVEVVWPNMEPVVLPEIKKSLKATVETIRDYDIKKLLVDSSKSIITIPYEENTQMALQMALDLKATRLVKIARIESKDSYRESKASEDAHKIQTSLEVPFQMKNFSQKATALAWLTSAS